MRITPYIQSNSLRFEIETIVTSKARPGGSFQSDAYSVGRGVGEGHAYRLAVRDASGQAVLKKRYGDKPDVALSPKGDMVVRRSAGLSDARILDVYKNEGGQLRRTKSFGSAGFLGFGNKSVTSFALNPQGDKLVFSVRSSGKIQLPKPKESYALHSDGHTETIKGPTRVSGHFERVFVHDLQSGATRELGYDRPHQEEGYFYPSFRWSPNGKNFAYESSSRSYAYVFDANGQHLSTHRTRENLGSQGGGAVPLLGVSDTGTPRFPPTSKYVPVKIEPTIPLGE